MKNGQNIRRLGEDIAHGAVVFPAGTRLTAAELPVIASLGIAEVEVVRKVRVAVFSTGDELQLPGQPLADGQIYDTNRLAVHLMLQELGCEVINLGIIPDDPAKLREAFIQADQQADVVISSGGVSVGEADYTKAILEELGEIGFWKLAIKPGKPFAFGKLNHSWFSAACCSAVPTASWWLAAPVTRARISSVHSASATALSFSNASAATWKRANGWKSSRLIICSEGCNGHGAERCGDAAL